MLRWVFGINQPMKSKMISPRGIGHAVLSVRAMKIHAAQLFTLRLADFPRDSYEFTDAAGASRD